MIEIYKDAFLKGNARYRHCGRTSQCSGNCMTQILKVARVDQRVVRRSDRPMLGQNDLVVFTKFVAKRMRLFNLIIIFFLTRLNSLKLGLI